jgi:phosphoribosylformylglycinamidine cyclo-ligase
MNKPSRYAQSGVDIKAADKAKIMMRQFVESTFDDSTVGEFGGFGGLYSLKKLTGKDVILVGSADGVGTKLKLAFATGNHDTIGRDLVNHLVNDILCCGAQPLFFFDYLGLGKIEQDTILALVKGISSGCKENQTVLLGGETAQMPGLYADGEYDIAGFIVGWVNEQKIIDGKSIKPGDKIIGLASNGLHTNGYSLARKAFFDIEKMKPGDYIKETGTEICQELMKIHRSYLLFVQPLIERGIIKGMAHITGGGFEGNITRILPEGVEAVIDCRSWSVPGVFRAIQRIAAVPTYEMYKVFNMGIGLILVCQSAACPELMNLINGVEAYEIGQCRAGQRGVTLLYE